MSTRFGVALLFVASSFVPGACGSSGGGTGPTARFALSGDTPPNLMQVPFPSDAYLVGGKIVDPLPGADALVPRGSYMLTHEIGKLNGFGRANFAFFYVDDPTKLDDSGNVAAAAIDPASLPANEDACIADSSSVFLVDLAPADPSQARIRCRGRIHDDSQTSGSRPVVAVGPGLGVVLEEGHRYAAVLTSRVRDTSDAHVVASADFQALLDGTRSGAIASMYGAAIDQVRTTLAGALATDGARIVAIAPFTTNAATREMFTLRETLDGLPVPTLAWDAQSMAPMGAAKFAALVNGVLPGGFTASLDDWLGVAPQKNGHDDPDFLTTKVLPHDEIAAIGTAVYPSPNFLVDMPGGFTTLDDRTFARDAQGNVVPNPAKPTVPVWVSFAVPKAPMPAGGYPCVIVSHGSPGSRAEAFMELANTFAAKGWMVAGIDLVTEGARSLTPKFDVDLGTEWPASNGTYLGPDGFADADPLHNASGRDPGFDYIGDAINFGAARDQQRQAVLDFSELARVLASNPDLSPLQTGAAAPKIDPTKIAYYGGSTGAIVGSITAAVDPNVRLWVLNVGGGHLFIGSAHAPVVQLELRSSLTTHFELKGQFIEETNPIAGLIQLAVDPADPINFAAYLDRTPGSLHGIPLPRRDVLQIEALYDESVANDNSEAFARAAGWGLAVPNVGPNSNIDTIDEVRDPSLVADPIALRDVPPDGAGLIHDSPSPGVTSVLVQVTGKHYRNMLQSSDSRLFSVPFNASTTLLANPFPIAQSYTAQQAMMVRFLDDGFRGNVPNVTGIPTPVRDVDEDGTPDAMDPDSNDPSVK